MEFQQNQATLPIAVLVVVARTNRLEHLARAIPNILVALAELQPKTLRKIVAS